MSAPAVLLSLVEVGAVLWVDGPRLCFRAPAGAVDGALRARAAGCRGALIALVRSGAVLPPAREDWPDEVRIEFEERAGFLEFHEGVTRQCAELQAEREVRVAHARAWLERAAMRPAS